MKELIMRVREKGNKEERIAELSVEGDLTISHADKLRDKLLDIMENYPKLEIKVQRAENIDLSIVQLLVSTAKTLGPEKFKMSVALTEDQKRLLSRAGLFEILHS